MKPTQHRNINIGFLLEKGSLKEVNKLIEERNTLLNNRQWSMWSMGWNILYDNSVRTPKLDRRKLSLLQLFEDDCCVWKDHWLLNA